MPILSVGKLTDDDNDVLIQKEVGKSHTYLRERSYRWKTRYGVYWIIVELDENILEPTKQFNDPDFHGHGAP